MAEQSKQPQIAVAEAIHLLQRFRGADLTQTIYQIEKSLKGVSAQNYSAVLTTSGAKAEVLNRHDKMPLTNGYCVVRCYFVALSVSQAYIQSRHDKTARLADRVGKRG